MSKQDYYETLGIGRQASAAEIKSAFRKLAMKHHPDRNPGDKAAEQRFKELNEAYEILKDDQKRAAYDQYGHAAFQNGGGRPGGGAGNFDFGSFADVFDDLFGDFMGGARGRGSQSRGADLRYNLEISLEEAFEGKQAQIKVPTTVPCETCDATGSKGSAPGACPGCRGTGRVRAQQGFFTIERTCPTCGGQGRVITDPCDACSGQGRVQREKTLSVKIPKGVEDGTRIRLSGEGEAGMRGGTTGDLYIFVSVAPHRMFQRDGANIHCRVPIPLTTAALGGQIDVPTIDGKRARLQVPEGTQTGHRFRLRSKGMTELNSHARGDMFAELTVETPINLTKRQKELLRSFEEESGGRDTHPESEGFFAKVRDLFSGDARD
jgi:molecular chaperone DnaJ